MCQSNEIKQILLYEPRYEKTGILHMRKIKTQISFAITAKLISTFVFATRIVQSVYFLNPKFQAFSHLLWLYSPVCVGPGWKPGRPVFSEQSSYGFFNINNYRKSPKFSDTQYFAVITLKFKQKRLSIEKYVQKVQTG